MADQDGLFDGPDGIEIDAGPSWDDGEATRDGGRDEDRDEDGGSRDVRSHEERMAAVRQAVASVTPERRVRTPEERRAALAEALEAQERRRRQRLKREQDERVATARLARPDAQPERPARPVLVPPRPHPVTALTRPTPVRSVRSDAERFADARAAAEEELARRKEAVEDLNRRLAERRAAAHGDGAGGNGARRVDSVADAVEIPSGTGRGDSVDLDEVDLGGVVSELRPSGGAEEG
jgi:hypothetical protein